MIVFLAVVMTAAVLILSGLRPASRDDLTRRQMCAAVRRAGVVRCTLIAVCVLAAVPVILAAVAVLTVLGTIDAGIEVLWPGTARTMEAAA
ncbi:hypothetical protein AB0I81_40300 [Nonomuraea sp. NPDC050404]|uniref:hypothetical protein n=1 Tax=Nonomuraea sp. NPDC050404 TaxID=3155783 RepID=UPI00340D8147